MNEINKNKNDRPKEIVQKYMATIKIGPKGQIIIPKDIRNMFGFKPGDTIMIMADINQGGAAITPFNTKLWDIVFHDAPKF